MAKLAEARRNVPGRKWHAAVLVLLAAGAWALIDTLFINQTGRVPTLKALWLLAPFPALLAGAEIAKWARGGTVGMRVKLAAVCGLVLGILAAGVNMAVIRGAFPHSAAVIAAATGGESQSTYALLALAWRAFWFPLLAVCGALIAEVSAPAPEPVFKPTD